MHVALNTTLFYQTQMKTTKPFRPTFQAKMFFRKAPPMSYNMSWLVKSWFFVKMWCLHLLWVVNAIIIHEGFKSGWICHTSHTRLTSCSITVIAATCITQPHIITSNRSNTASTITKNIILLSSAQRKGASIWSLWAAVPYKN